MLITFHIYMFNKANISEKSVIFSFIVKKLLITFFTDNQIVSKYCYKLLITN